MKLNKEMIERLAKGECIYKHTGKREQVYLILKNAFPNDKFTWHGYVYIFAETETEWNGYNNYSLLIDDCPHMEEKPIYTTDQFFQVETDQIPDVGKMPQEKREFFLQVCASSYALKSVIPYDTQIEHAWEFTNKVFEKLNQVK